MSTVRFAIIGYGHIGKRHHTHIDQHPHATLVGICDLPDVIKLHKDHLPIPLFSDISSLIYATQPDIVCVCTPNHLHAEHTIRTLELGCHVLCEKPFALSSKDCDEIIEKARLTQKTVFVVKQNRYNPPVAAVKKRIDDGSLGKIFSAHVNCFWNRNEQYYNQSDWRGDSTKDGGCLFTQFSHFVDILYYLMGKITPLSGYLTNSNHPYINIEDTGSVFLQSDSGALISFNFSTNSYKNNMEGSITLLAENGSIKIGGQYLNTIEYVNADNITLDLNMQSNQANDYGNYQGSMSNHDKVIDNVVQTLHGKATAMTNAHEGKLVVEIIENMYRVSKRI